RPVDGLDTVEEAFVRVIAHPDRVAITHHVGIGGRVLQTAIDDVVTPNSDARAVVRIIGVRALRAAARRVIAPVRVPDLVNGSLESDAAREPEPDGRA